VSAQAVREYLALIWSQYQGSSRAEKSKLIDEVVRNTGMHRKSVIRLLCQTTVPKFKRGKGESRNRYSDESKVFLKALWKDMGYLGGVRMKAAIPLWIDSWENEDLGDYARHELKSMSASTIERTLKKAKADLRRRSNTGTRRSKTRPQALIPIRDFAIVPAEPGHCEIDCVAHCGGSLSGEHIWTLTVTDIVSGWTEEEALQAKTGILVHQALLRIEERLPFKIIALYMDNGSEFLNDEVAIKYAHKKKLVTRVELIQLFRSRPYKKNDQCMVEQKNFTHVRELFGYDRFEGRLMAQQMNNVYRKEWRQLSNFFHPQIRLKEKYRVGSKVKRRFHAPRTPLDLLGDYLPEQQMVSLRLEAASLNPFFLQKKLKRKLRDISAYNSRDPETMGRIAQ